VDVLQKLDKLEQGELRTVAAQVLKATIDLKDGAQRAACSSGRIIHTEPLHIRCEGYKSDGAADR
jgi:hypothetical protein